MDIEKIILKNIYKNETYMRKVLPFLNSEYFHKEEDRKIFEVLKNFIVQYNEVPTAETIDAALQSEKNEAMVHKKIMDSWTVIRNDPGTYNDKWLLDNTETFCQDKALYNAIMKSIGIMQDEKSTLGKGAIPDILSNALAVSFDPRVGHSFFDDYEKRFEYYHRVRERIPFDLEFFNKITKGGIPKKTLNICLGGTGAGKSLFLCHYAAACLNQGKNVLYITLELAEEEIAKRIEANLFNLSFDDLMVLDKASYIKKIESLRNNTQGELYVEEYPTASASTIHFKALLNELNLKKSFKPDIIFVDYINICTSARIKPGASVNSYTFIKAIAEELRGMAVEYDVPVFSATQTNRSGYDNSDVDLTNTSESFGLPATADFMFAIISTEELRELNQLMIKQLKSRYGDIEDNKRFVVGIDRSKMKLYDAENSAQKGIVDSGQKTENSTTNKFRALKVTV